MTTLAEIVMVTMGLADGADATLMKDRDVDFHCDNPKLTAFGCRRGTSTRNDLHDQLVGSVSCDPMGVNYTVQAYDHKDSFRNFCLVNWVQS